MPDPKHALKMIGRDAPEVQTVVFDLDGTLLDTLADLAAAANQVLIAHGLPASSVENYRLFVGAGARNLMLRAFTAAGQVVQAGDPWLDTLSAEFGRAYDRCWADQTKPYPGILQMLRDLSDAGLNLIILSNKPDLFTRNIVAHFFSSSDFAAVSGQQAGWPLKPDPSLALELCRRIGAQPGQTVLVGDSGSDMQTAVRGQIIPLGVLWGFRSADELKQNGAQQLFADPAALTGWLVRHAAEDSGAAAPAFGQRGDSL